MRGLPIYTQFSAIPFLPSPYAVCGHSFTITISKYIFAKRIKHSYLGAKPCIIIRNYNRPYPCLTFREFLHRIDILAIFPHKSRFSAAHLKSIAIEHLML